MAKINGKLGIDENLLGTEADDIIKGFDGDDTITPGAGNDIITGGTGNNTINIDLKTCKEQGLTFGDDIVNLTKGEKLTLNIIAEEDPTNPNAVNIGNYAIKTNGKDYTIAFYQSSNLIQDESGNYVENTDDIIGSITFKNFAAKDVLGAEGSLIIKVNDFEMDLVKEIYTIGQNSFESTMVNYDTIFNNGWVKTGVIKGTRISEDINASEYEGIGKKAGKGVTINAGAGNDNITGSKYDDKITGGVGDNTINVSLNGKFGDDTIILTKNENLVINVTGDGQYTWDNYRTSVDGKDFVVKFYSESWQKEDSYLGSIRIKDFAAKNGVGENGSVVLKAGALTYDLTKEIFDLSIGGEAIDTSNIRMAEYGTIEGMVNTSWVKKGVINGSRLGETFTASGVKDAYDKKGTKGVTINAGGGDDIATGSNFADKINGGDGDDILDGYAGNDILNGGDGNDILKGGAGNDVITGGKGKNTIIHFAGGGNDVINLTKGEQLTLQVEAFDHAEIAANRKDVLIYTSETEYITIKNLAAKDVTNNATKKADDTSDVLLQVAGQEPIDIRNYMIDDWLPFYSVKTSKNYTGTWLGEAIEALPTNGKGLSINAGGGDDHIYGSEFNDILKGGDGDDYIWTYGGKDKVYGGNGNDYLISNAGEPLPEGTELEPSILYGEKGNDIIEIWNTGDIAYGGEGDDLINFRNNTKQTGYGGKGNDTFWITKGNATVYGEAGDDEILGGKESASNIVFAKGGGHDTYTNRGAADVLVFDKINASAISFEKNGNDLVINYGKNESVTVKDYTDDMTIYIETKDGGKVLLSNMINSVYGTTKLDNIVTDKKFVYTFAGNDNVTITGDGSKVYAGEGNDTITGGTGKDYLYGQAGDDKLYGGAGKDNISGGAGNDYIEGGDDKDSLYGGDGNDTIYGGNGDDLIGNSNSEAGDDEFHGGDGVDTIYGGAGNDTLYGDAGDDKIYGNRGDDIIYGGAGNDTIYGETNSNDAATGNNYIDAGTGDDKIYGGAGIDTIILNEGKNTVNAYDGDDKIYGGNGDDHITAGHGNNYVETGDGTDYAICGSGNDTIILGAGTKTVTSAKGDDVITLTKSIAETKVTVKDSEGNDTINLADNKDNVNVVFNIDAEGNMDYDGVRLIADSDVDSWKTNFSTIGGIKLTIDTTDIETITTADGYQLTATDINTLKENVASWLTADGRSYSDVEAVLSSGNDTDIAALMAQFENAGWEQQSV